MNMMSKKSDEYIVNANNYINYLLSLGRIKNDKMPRAVILCFQNSLANRILEQSPEARKIDSSRGSFYIINDSFGLVFDFGIGSPVAAMLMEELIVLGVQNFYLIGIAGSLQSKASIGDFVVVDAAIREDGVSDHYIAVETGNIIQIKQPTIFKKVVDIIVSKSSNKVHYGTTWSICAPYRESKKKRDKYVYDGAIAVEMEVAALATVAQEKTVNFGALLIISDLLFEKQWMPKQTSPEVLESLVLGYSALRQALLEESLF